MTGFVATQLLNWLVTLSNTLRLKRRPWLSITSWSFLGNSQHLWILYLGARCKRDISFNLQPRNTSNGRTGDP